MAFSMLCRDQENEEKVLLLADSHDTLFQGGTAFCPAASVYANMYWSHEADVIFQADGVSLHLTLNLCYICSMMYVGTQWIIALHTALILPFYHGDGICFMFEFV